MCACSASELACVDLSLGNILYRTKVRDANRQYEFNYNGEVDNGLLIGTKDVQLTPQKNEDAKEQDIFKP